MGLDCGYKPRAGAWIHCSFLLPPSASRSPYFLHPLLQVTHSFIPGNGIRVISLHSSVWALESPRVVPLEAISLWHLQGLTGFRSGWDNIQNPRYCHYGVFILLDKGTFSSVPPGAQRGESGHKFVCLEPELHFAQPTEVPKHWLWPHPLPPCAPQSVGCAIPLPLFLCT